jgi:predicted secreted Zn-dependent protease
MPACHRAGDHRSVTKRRLQKPVGSLAGDPGPEWADEGTGWLDIPVGDLARRLRATDAATRADALGHLQTRAGNAAVDRLLAERPFARSVRSSQVTLTRSTGSGAGHVALQRDPSDVAEEVVPEEPVPLDAGAGTGATETIGPATESGYAVTGSSLADVEAFISGLPEAGRVDWAEGMDYHQTDGIIDSVTVTVGITLEMPSWSPPSTMLPKARAEWTRWYAALRAHEQGHIDLVHQVFDGLAAKMLGKPAASGDRTFAAAKASLRKKSKAYDGRTSHGIRQGTTLNVSIEQKELDEERRRQEEAGKSEGRQGSVPDVGDEGGD